MLHSEHDKIIIPIINGLRFEDADTIIRVKANANYSDFIFEDGSMVQSSHTLKFFEFSLLPHGFIRVHESHIINPAFIKEYIKGDGGIITMKDGSEVDVARERKYEFLLAVAIRWGSAKLFSRIINHLH